MTAYRHLIGGVQLDTTLDDIHGQVPAAMQARLRGDLDDAHALLMDFYWDRYELVRKRGRIRAMKNGVPWLGDELADYMAEQVLRAIQRWIEQDRVPVNVGAVLERVLNNAWASFRRAKKLQRRVEARSWDGLEVAGAPEDPLRSVFNAHFAAHRDRAIERLRDPRHATAMRLLYRDEQTVADIAEETGLSVDNVHQIASRFRKSLDTDQFRS